MSSSSPAASYMPHIDFLRVLAVLMVLMHHWSPQSSLLWFNAEMGVQLFFVISGYLITGILLDARTKAGERGVPTGRVLKRFYIRRFLRIFPLYYLVLGLAFAAGISNVTDSILWHVAYLSNFYIAITGSWHGHISHFWSLAVEEQFYFVWPWLMLFLPRRALLPAIIAAGVVSIVYVQVGARVFHLSSFALDVIPLSSLYTLGAGSLLALLERRLTDRARQLHRTVVGIGAFGAAGYLAIRFVEGGLLPMEIAMPVRQTVMLPMALTGIVFGAAKGVPGPIGRFMILAPFRYLGRISYGLYIFHNFMEHLLGLICPKLGIPLDPSQPTLVVFMAKFVLLVACASLTWFCFENPINNLKRHFPYSG